MIYGYGRVSTKGQAKQASWLVVDELNRSEIDKVFGDLFTVFGSDDLDKRKLPLWFENDLNKQLLYVPRRYRIIGLMNNVDKNYVFDLSQGLARRFTIINVLPPDKNSFINEIANCKKVLAKKLPNKIRKIGSANVDEVYINTLLSKRHLVNEEQTLIELLKQIRYALKWQERRHVTMKDLLSKIYDYVWMLWQH